MNCQVDVMVDGRVLPTIKTPRILGVIFDQLLFFNNHARNVRKKLKTMNNVLKALAGSTMGEDKETIVTT